ncbi:hypothetical protein HZA55_03425 [Candidatus Poribacteria bacterium]|nr:hypothetical protein [Candidatus Poribacteria bacterium]
MVPGCPYLKKVTCDVVQSAQCYCMGYASGKLRVPVLYEEMCYCKHDEKFIECNTYQVAVNPQDTNNSILFKNKTL